MSDNERESKKRYLSKLKVPAYYGGKTLFRLRAREHALDQMTVRGQFETKLKAVQAFAGLLENPKLLKKKPHPFMYFVYYVEAWGEAYIFQFRELKKDPTRKENVKLDMILQTYVKHDVKELGPFKVSYADTCVVFRNNGDIQYGVDNKFFAYKEEK